MQFVYQNLTAKAEVEAASTVAAFQPVAIVQLNGTQRGIDPETDTHRVLQFAQVVIGFVVFLAPGVACIGKEYPLDFLMMGYRNSRDPFTMLLPLNWSSR